jgi:hypothetical protein
MFGEGLGRIESGAPAQIPFIPERGTNLAMEGNFDSMPVNNNYE